MKPFGTLVSLFFLLSLLGCGHKLDPDTEKDLNTPIVPEGFDLKTLEGLKCPENGSKLRIATKRELAKLNDRIGAFKTKRWDGELRINLVEAALIRADGKIAYRIDGVTPILEMSDALVLDEKVGLPNPAKNFK